MRRVALTGAIATGKSYVLDRFRDLGAACLEADHLVHGVMVAGTEATRAIAARFGIEMLDAEGAVDRRRLGRVVFSDAAARRDLEAIVHPPVRRAIEAALRALVRTGEPVVAIVEIPLLYEAGRASEFDRVIATVCSPALQLTRLAARGLSEAEARQRIAAQMPAEEKGRLADDVIRTDGSFENTNRQVDEIWTRLS